MEGVAVNYRNAFHGRNVFVTGHTGFKGSWLSLWLRRLGAVVTGYSLMAPTQPNNFELSGVTKVLARDYRADIRDSKELHAAMASSAPDVVFHLAAQPLVRNSYELPFDTFDVNVMGTARVLEAVKAMARPCVVIVITSDKCYENREQVWGYRETDALGGFDPYSASKGAAEILTASYRDSFFSPQKIAQHGVKVATARAGNVIGGGDWAKDRIVADIVRSLSAGRAVQVRNPRAVRPWQHVLEPLNGYLSLAARMLHSNSPALCGGWNFGPLPGDEMTVGELAERFCKTWGSGSWRDCSSGTQPHEAHSLRLCIDKAISELNWRPRWTPAETIERTARWYRRLYSEPGRAMQDMCYEDIAAYEAVPVDGALQPRPE